MFAPSTRSWSPTTWPATAILSQSARQSTVNRSHRSNVSTVSRTSARPIVSRTTVSGNIANFRVVGQAAASRLAPRAATATTSIVTAMSRFTKSPVRNDRQYRPHAHREVSSTTEPTPTQRTSWKAAVAPCPRRPGGAQRRPRVL